MLENEPFLTNMEYSSSKYIDDQ